MSRGILVTLDGSPLSEAVLPVVADLAAGLRSVVTLFRVGELPEATLKEPAETVQPSVILNVESPVLHLPSRRPRYAETRTQAIDRKGEELTGYLEEKARTLRERGIEVRTIVEFGNPAERIIEYARRPEIDLIAMATHGHTGLRTLIFGSVASRVLFSGVRPVVIARPSRQDRGWLVEDRLPDRTGARQTQSAGER